MTEPPHVRSEDTAAFGAVLARALRRVNADRRLPPDAARELRQAIAATSRDARSAVAFEPDAHLGPFDALPDPARAAVVEAILDRERWETRGYEQGRLYPLLLRFLWRIKHAAYRRGDPARSGFARLARELSDVLAYGARRAPASAIAMLRRLWLAARGRLVSRPNVPEMLSMAGIEPRNLAVCYARDLPQAEQYRGYWHDESRHVTVGRILGLDLLPADDGCWFVESNANPAQTAARAELSERDPMIRSLFEFAGERGYRHVVAVLNNSSGVVPKLGRQYAEEARSRGIRLTMLEMPNVPGRNLTRSYALPPVKEEATLVVRIKPYPTGLDHMFEMKRATYRALALYRRETGDPDLLLPATGSDPILTDLAPDDPFPNVVYKFPELEQGRGVYFLKANSVEHARAIVEDAVKAPQKRELQERMQRAFTNKQGVYQPYVKSRLLYDRRLYKVRALVLLTPVGVRFLAGGRVISGVPVPERLDSGVVSDPRPYLVNLMRGGRPELMPDDEEPAVARAATAVARGLAWAAEYAYRTRALFT